MRWPKVRLGEVLTRSDEWIDLIADKTYREVTVRLWGKGIVLRREATGAEIVSSRRMVVHHNQFLLSRIDARNGAMGIVPEELDGAVVTNDFPAFIIDSTRAEPSYLNWLSKTGDFVKLCEIASEGTTNRVRLKEDRFLNLEIPLPPLSEQQRIVARIEQLALKIEEARGLRRQAVEEVEVIFIGELNRIFLALSSNASLGNAAVCDIVCGQHLNPEEQAESGIPYMTGPADFTERVAVPSRFALTARAKCQTGDVLLTVKGAGVGKVNLAPDKPAAIGRQLFSLRPVQGTLDQTFLWFVLKFKLAHLRDAMTATTVPGIGRKDVEQLKIPLPPIAEQHRIVAYLDDLQVRFVSLKCLQADTAAEIDALLPSVLDKAFKGKL
jgi:type I restriction enzyme S subunit